MCQQTQAERVVPRYERFLDRFPTEATLARAAPAEVLAEWSGLGYNRRAMHLHRAASVVERGWPRTVEGLLALPGVGPYTAAAVACFAFGVPVAAVDTNLRRVLSRWYGRPLAGLELEEAAGAELDRKRPAAWTSAMMDLGATICRPQPACVACPVAEWCADPGVYAPPLRQGRFAGSSRQARGAIVRALVAGAHSERALADVTGLAADRLAPALSALQAEGMVVAGPCGYSLPQ